MTAATVVEAYDLGLRHFAENRVQDLVAKCAALAAARPDHAVTWELIGPLQRNKARAAVAVASRITSVGSVALVETLDRIAAERATPLHIALQVNVAGDPAKSGFAPDELVASVGALATIARQGNLRFDGLMTVGWAGATEAATRTTFAALRNYATELAATAKQAGFAVGPLLSAGMSGDFEVAIEEGATQVRLGSALFGERARLEQ